MVWFVASVCCLVVGGAALRFWRLWLRPWKDVEQLVHDVINGRAPRTFLIDGNRSAQRIGVALEDVSLRQQELAKRAGEDELNIRAILGAMRDGLAVIDADGRVRLWNRRLRELFAINDEHAGATLLQTFRDTLVVETVTRLVRCARTCS
jgi:two-component system, OmpR family, phosphate regulon sensor histidine kinase PhoR